MSEADAVVSSQKQMVCRVTKRSADREITDTKVLLELQRLGVSATILESLRTAREDRTEHQKTVSETNTENKV